MLVCICMRAGAHLSSLPSSSLEPLSAAEGRAVNAQRTPSADSGTVWGKPPGFESAPVPRSSESWTTAARGRGPCSEHGTTPLSGAVNAQRYPPRHVLARRRGGRWLPIAGLRARAAASQVRAYTFAERRFSPALHGLGVTGHEPVRPRILADSTGRTASSSERFASGKARVRGVATNFADGVADGPGTLHLLGRPLAVLWSPGGHCAAVVAIAISSCHLVAMVLQSLL